MSSSTSLRQSENFAGQSWDTVFKAFTTVSLKSYDFDSIRTSMVEYIQRLAPESYNDWIESSEFIFIIDLLAYIGQSLAFRTELNARESFLDTAERRENILKLAKMLSYNGKRNYPSRGLLKLAKVKTTQEIYDSNGINIQNMDIVWNDPTNTNWNERMILLLNNAFNSTNQFGLPVKQDSRNGVLTQLYQINNIPLVSVVDKFSSSINGRPMSFETVNTDIDNLGIFVEKFPNPIASRTLIYRSDGSGNASPDTGFFTYFKQGNLQFSDYSFEVAIENRTVDINVDNINELDVWVQEINDSGLVIQNWTRVPSTDSITFNEINRQDRNVFSVITRDNDQISIKFGDGRFGKSPIGLYRVWYRVSNGLRYNIRSNDLQNVTLTIPYNRDDNNLSQRYTLTLTFNLEYGISSRDVGASVPKETIDQIKQRANQVYYTQNRMVNGEDYNLYPLQRGNTVRKIQAINRVYSGQTRYLDISDPTGRYQNTNLFSDDGIIYRENFTRNDFENIPSIKSNREIINARIQPLMDEVDLRDFYLANFARYNVNMNPLETRWSKATGNNFGTTGQFKVDPLANDVFQPQPVGLGQPGSFNYINEGSMLKFVNPSNANDYKWASVVQISGSGVDPLFVASGIGPVILSETIEDNWLVTIVIPAFRKTLTEQELSIIEDQFISKTTFAMRYNANQRSWMIIPASDINYSGAFSLTYAGDTTSTNLDASWLVLIEYLPAQGYWKFTTRNIRYVFESVKDSRFFFVDDYKVTDATRGLTLKDYIKILKYNTKPSPTSTPLGKEYSFNLVKSFVYEDGYIEPRRVQISFTDSNADGVVDDPTIFDFIVDPTATEAGSSMNMRYVYQQKVVEAGYDYFVPKTDMVTVSTFASINTGNVPNNTSVYVRDTAKFFTRNGVGVLSEVTDKSFKAFIGRNNINYQWKHFVPEDQRIDPAYTNIMDMFILTESYYQSVQTWVKSINKPLFPTAPTSDELKQELYDIEKAKMISDEIIWQSAKFKLLFGDGATEELKAQFKVIKVQGSSVTDNEIKQGVIDAVNQFFSIDNWSFGETLYYTELAAYIHQSLSTIVASVVIVPKISNSKFGTLFQIRSETSELFLSTATVSDVFVVDSFTPNNIKIGL